MVQLVKEFGRRVDQYRSFWERTPASRITVSLTIDSGAKKKSVSNERQAAAGTVKASEYDYKKQFTEYRRLLAKRLDLKDDKLPPIRFPTPSAFLAAAVGARVTRDRNSVLWVDPLCNDLDEISKIRLDESNEWLSTVLEATAYYVSEGEGQYPVVSPSISGPGELLSALVGAEKVLLSLYTEPERLKNAVKKCADITIEVQRVILDLLPDFHGGTVSWLGGMWLPGKGITLAEDNLVSISPDTYAEFFQDEDRRIAASFDSCVFHLHSTAVHLVDRLLEIDEIQAIEVAADPNGFSLEEMMPFCRKIQAKKRLMVSGYCFPFTDDELEKTVCELKPEGLALNLRKVGSTEDGVKLLDDIRDWTKRQRRRNCSRRYQP